MFQIGPDLICFYTTPHVENMTVNMKKMTVLRDSRGDQFGNHSYGIIVSQA